MDYTNCTNNIHASEISLPGGTLPLGVEIQQLSFMYNCPGLQGAYFVKWKIINKSGRTWDSTYISIFNDADIGNAFDDAAGCDSARELGFMYNAVNFDPLLTPPPALGFRLLQSPLIHTGNSNDTAYLPYDTLIGYKLIRMTGCNVFLNGSPDPCLNDPGNAIAGYNFMRGRDGCGRIIINPVSGQPTTFKYSGDACSRAGWFDSLSHDARYLVNSGPFVMNSQDTQIVVMGCFIARGSDNYQSVCALQYSSNFIRASYYSDFCVSNPIGININSNEMPSEYKLYKNYPNPFNPATKIKFDVPAGSELRTSVIKLIIYDALGREITVLVNEQLKPSSYELEWNATDFPSGVYFYKLSAADYSESKKMVLIR